MDLDNTITLHSANGYADAIPNLPVIARMREYKSQGFEIVIATARNMRTYDNNIGKVTANMLPLLFDWLRQNEVPYDEIWVGKPWCGHQGFYVDDKAVRPHEFTSMDYRTILEIIASSTRD
jgi:capsule biosynthesis phosphatase